jgi:hypothetical protein
LNVNQKHWVIYRLGVQSPFLVKDRGVLPKGFFVIASPARGGRSNLIAFLIFTTARGLLRRPSSKKDSSQ